MERVKSLMERIVNTESIWREKQRLSEFSHIKYKQVNMYAVFECITVNHYGNKVSVIQFDSKNLNSLELLIKCICYLLTLRKEAKCATTGIRHLVTKHLTSGDQKGINNHLVKFLTLSTS